MEYNGTIEVPFPNFILAFGEKNVKDIITYSNLWNEDIADEIMWRDHKVRDYEINKKYVECFEINPNDYGLFDLIFYMFPCKRWLKFILQKRQVGCMF